MATTLKSNVIVPEVLAGYVESKLTNNSVFAPLADVDDTLTGQGGDTLTFPKYAYIGKADVTAENGEIIPVALSTSSVTRTVHKLTKAIQITDEARMSAYGDPFEEGSRQLAKAIDDTMDDEFLDELKTAPKSIGFMGALTPDNLIDALAMFGEDEDGVKALALSPKDKSALRKNDDYINGSDIATDIKIRGADGELWGCQFLTSNRLNGNTNQRDAYIVKPGALSLILKRGVLIETKRESEFQRDSVFASKHYVPYLKDESKVIRICEYFGLQALAAGVATSVAGDTAANDTYIKISESAPENTKWVYKLGSSDVTPTWGTGVTGYTDWVNDTTEIAASSSTKASIILVNAADNKPLKYTNITLTKKA